MMYGPAAAGFMDWARAHGAVPRDGLGMLVEQAAEAFEIWRGVRPPTARCWPSCAPSSTPSEGPSALVRLPADRGASRSQLFFIVRIAAMAVIDPQSTAFQRSEAWQLATARAQQRRTRLAPALGALARISDSLKRAVIASEDSEFVYHQGVEWEAIERARQRNAKAEEIAARRAAQMRARGKKPRPAQLRGGSTITQQLAKNLLLSGERTLLRSGPGAGAGHRARSCC